MSTLTTAELGTQMRSDGRAVLVSAKTVQALKRRIADADGLLLATPEYNFGIPGVLKNAIDWASRPGFKSVLAHKRVAVIGAALS